MSVRARVSSGDPVTSDISRSPQAPCPPTNSQATALHHDLAAPLPGSPLAVSAGKGDGRRPGPHVARWVDFSLARLDVHVMDEAGAPILVTTAASDSGGLASLAHRVSALGQPVAA